MLSKNLECKEQDLIFAAKLKKMIETEDNLFYIPVVSTFRRGYINKQDKAVPSSKVYNDVDLVTVYNYIRQDYAKEATKYLRSIKNHDEAQRFKMLNFITMTPGGAFSYRNANHLNRHSGLMVIDIDGIASQKRLFEVRDLLLHDPVFETELLFISPSGNGLKWIICVGPQDKDSHSKTFAMVSQYLACAYGIEADPSGSDVSRLCYLPHDPECYINPEFIREY